MKTVTRADLVVRVVEEMGFPLVLANKLVGDLIGAMTDELANRKSVKISSFATFRVYKRRARKGMDMSTGEAVAIGERYALQFRSSSGFEDKLC